MEGNGAPQVHRVFKGLQKETKTALTINKTLPEVQPVNEV